MNKTQSATIRACAARLREARSALPATRHPDIVAIRDNLQNSYDNHSERWKDTAAATLAQNEIDSVEALLDALAEIDDAFKTAFFALDQLIPPGTP